MYKVYSQKEPRVDKGEEFLLESLTDQLADEPLDKMVARFIATGGFVPQMAKSDLAVPLDDNGVPKVDNLEESVDAAMDDLATEDVAAMDRADAAELLQQLNEVQAVVSANAAKAKDEPRTSSGALESNDADADTPKVEKPQE